MSRLQHTIGACLCMLTLGCESQAPRTIDDLYQEAMQVSQERRTAALDAARTAADETVQLPLESCPPWAEVDRAPDTSPRVSDLFLEASLREVIPSLALQAGVQVTIDEAVEGRVSAQLEDVGFETALDRILPAGVVWVKRRGHYLIALDDPSSSSFPAVAQSRLYRPHHLPAGELVGLLPPHLARYVQTNDERNLISVYAPPSTLRRVEAELTLLDQEIPQVEIEAIICELSPDEALQTGFDFEHGFELENGRAGVLSLQDLAGGGTFAPAGLQGTETFAFYSAFVQLLAHEGLVAIRAAPRVRVQDGKQARILIGDQTYFTVTQGEAIFRELRSIETGIVLDLLPRVMGGREVSILIERAEVSDEIRPTNLVPTPDGTLPTVSTRRVHTTVQLADGETVVLGGLVRRREVERVVKIPFLGDIPVLGRLFQRTDSRVEEAEVTIFLTARIVR